jgi:hypothetical protein
MDGFTQLPRHLDVAAMVWRWRTIRLLCAYVFIVLLRTANTRFVAATKIAARVRGDLPALAAKPVAALLATPECRLAGLIWTSV